MSKFLVFCIIALAVLMTIPAYAEVQNVKVSGDLAARWLLRGTYDLDKNNNGVSNASDNYFMSSAEVQVDADLTDNVSTVVRLGNQKNWGDPAGVRAGAATTQNFNLDLDLASVTLKELVYSPLTVKIGRQDLWFGRGFIIGAKQRDQQNSISAKEYTIFNSFDAIRATLDFDPWKIDGVYSMIEEPLTNKATRTMLSGINVGYKFDSYKGEAEGYLWRKTDDSKVAYVNGATSATCEKSSVNTLGIRGSLEPIANASLAGELAMQSGFYSTYAAESRSRNAMAWDVSGDYNFKDIKWSPKLGLEYIYYSGESKTTVGDAQGNRWNSWDPMYRGKFDSAIREFQNVYYATAMRSDNVTTQSLDQDSGMTNQHQVLLIGSVKPTNSIKLDGRVGWFTMAKAQTVSSSTRSRDVGTELDLTLTYDYTEDVSFGLLAGWFFPGKYWLTGQDDLASDIVGTVKVAF